MKHNDYFQLVEDMASRIPMFSMDCPFEFIFENGKNYCLRKSEAPTNITLEIYINPRYHSDGRLGASSYSEAIYFHRKRDINGDYLGSMDSNIDSEIFWSGLGGGLIMGFQKRTESEDNYLKLRAGKFYKDVCLLYTKLSEKLNEQKES